MLRSCRYVSTGGTGHQKGRQRCVPLTAALQMCTQPQVADLFDSVMPACWLRLTLVSSHTAGSTYRASAYSSPLSILRGMVMPPALACTTRDGSSWAAATPNEECTTTLDTRGPSWASVTALQACNSAQLVCSCAAIAGVKDRSGLEQGEGRVKFLSPHTQGTHAVMNTDNVLSDTEYSVRFLGNNITTSTSCVPAQHNVFPTAHPSEMQAHCIHTLLWPRQVRLPTSGRGSAGPRLGR